MNAARLDRALAVLGYLAHHHEGRTLKHLSEDLQLPVSSTHDLLQALIAIGAVRPAGDKTYAIGPRAIALALTIGGSISIRAVAAPHLKALCENINENVYLILKNGTQVTYADRYEASQPLAVVMQLGDSRPLHASAAGKLMTAFDPELEALVLSDTHLEEITPFTMVTPEKLSQAFAEIRNQRYSISDGESVEGITGVATPIISPDGTVRAGVHVSAPRGRLPQDRILHIIAQMTQTAEDISRLIGAGAQQSDPVTLALG